MLIVSRRLARLDSALIYAEKYGIKLVLSILNIGMTSVE